MQKTKIEWADRVWNPVTGCNSVSAGCKNCYARRMHNRFFNNYPFEKIIMHPERLEYPMTIRKPSIVFVDSMSDLFHKDVTFDFIFDVFKQMKSAEQHTFLILTKRPEIMWSFFDWLKSDRPNWPTKPLDNVGLGVSIEDQKAADERLVWLANTPAAFRFVSIEPMLGEIHLQGWHGDHMYNWLDHSFLHQDFGRGPIDWVICGGETGPYARPMQIDWVRHIRAECNGAGVPFFFKQWGEWRPATDIEMGEGMVNVRVGKNSAGHLLDGIEWVEKPECVIPKSLRDLKATISEKTPGEVQMALEVK